MLSAERGVHEASTAWSDDKSVCIDKSHVWGFVSLSVNAGCLVFKNKRLARELLKRNNLLG